MPGKTRLVLKIIAAIFLPFIGSIWTCLDVLYHWLQSFQFRPSTRFRHNLFLTDTSINPSEPWLPLAGTYSELSGWLDSNLFYPRHEQYTYMTEELRDTREHQMLRNFSQQQSGDNLFLSQLWNHVVLFLCNFWKKTNWNCSANQVMPAAMHRKRTNQNRNRRG